MRQWYTAHDVTTLVKSNGENSVTRFSFPIETIYKLGGGGERGEMTDRQRLDENAVGILLGHGWQSMAAHTPAARLLLSITTADGKTMYVATDNTTWKGSRAGPIRRNNIYGGETYDARMEMAGWSSAGFDDSHWAAATSADEFAGKGYRISWQPMNPIR